MKLPFKSHPDLDHLIEQAKSLPPMTRTQRQAQQKSWVIGNMLLDHPEMTRQEAEEIYNRVTYEGDTAP